MKKTFTKIASGVLTIAMVALYMPSFADAAAATTLSDNMDRQKISEAATHVITFTLPTALPIAGTVDVTFPVAFTGTAATGTANWTAPSSNVVRYTAVAAQGAATVYTVTVTGMINPVAASTPVIDISSSNTDTGEITVPIIDEDQIFVTAKVDQTLSFDVIDAGDTDNSVDFGSLTSGAIRYAHDTTAGDAAETANGSSQFIAATNATGGYTISAQGETLTSGADTITAIAGVAPTFGQEEFGLTIDAVSGTTGTITTTYTGVNYDLPATATAEVVVTQGTPAATGTYGVNYVANIDGATEAGNYTATIIYTMTANF